MNHGFQTVREARNQLQAMGFRRASISAILEWAGELDIEVLYPDGDRFKILVPATGIDRIAEEWRLLQMYS